MTALLFFICSKFLMLVGLVENFYAWLSGGRIVDGTIPRIVSSLSLTGPSTIDGQRASFCSLLSAVARFKVFLL